MSKQRRRQTVASNMRAAAIAVSGHCGSVCPNQSVEDLRGCISALDSHIGCRAEPIAASAPALADAHVPAFFPLPGLPQVYQAPRVLQSPFASSSTTAAATLRFRLLDKQLLLLAVPTLFDLAGAALLNVGLLAVTASATQMLRQSLLPFAALMGVCLWGKRMNRYHLTGLAGCMVSIQCAICVVNLCLWGKRMNRYHLTGLAGCMVTFGATACIALTCPLNTKAKQRTPGYVVLRRPHSLCGASC